MVMFDLPTITDSERKHAVKFRKFLIKDGYTMLQFSVYIRTILGEDRFEKHFGRIQKQIPPRGEVRCLRITPTQFDTMKTLIYEPYYKKPTLTHRDNLVFW